MKKPSNNKPRVYDPAKIESKWQKKWAKSKIYISKEEYDKPKYYVLDMFPYPSGEGLHVGHPKGYIATDVVSRYRRMKGCSVLHPMGFDAFGLPAENYALKTKTHPEIATKKNVERYKEQLEMLGFDYDWSREVNTTDPKYYKWTQWIFLQLFKKGLAFESYEPINWCPSCKTGLANEDVENGRCERCGTLVEKKPLRQWVLKITDYAERLLSDLDAKTNDARPLIDWPASIVKLQKDWIGKSEGALIDFSLIGHKEKIQIFTTRPDTLFGVIYVVLAPEHKIIDDLLKQTSNKAEVEKYIDFAKKETEIDRTDIKKEKTGVELKGVKVINPANGEEVPVWIADYVLVDYGTGAVMAVPAHDERDWEFAKKFNLPVRQVIAPYFTENGDSKDAVRLDKKTVKRNTAYALVVDEKSDRFLCLNWEKFGWHSGIIGGIDVGETAKEAAMREIKEETGYVNIEYVRDLGGEQHNHFFATHKDENRYAVGQGMLFRLIDEERIPTKEEDTKNHKAVWIKKSEMAKWLNLSAFTYMWNVYATKSNCFTGTGKLINSGKFNESDSVQAKSLITKEFGLSKTTYKLRDWVFSRQRYWGEPIPLIHCEKCGVVAVPEKDLPVKLPKVKSYEPTGTGESPLAAISKWVNVKCPQCKGKARRETNTMPQWAGSSWYYLRYEDAKNNKALVDPKKEKYWSPVDLYVGGAEHATRHLIYARFWHKFLYDIGVVSTTEPFTKLQHVGLIMGEDGRKMSKRFGNVVNPDDVVKTFGADTLRVYEMFMGPFDQQIAWSTSSMTGPRRFIEKVWRLAEKVGGRDVAMGGADQKASPDHASVLRILHRTIKKVTDDIESLRFNTAISTLMIAVNELEKMPTLEREHFEILLKLLAPFAPHVADELWTSIGNKESIHISEWPTFDGVHTIDSSIRIIVQVNGKVRGSFETSPDTAEEGLKEAAKSVTDVKKWLEGKEIKKVIIVKGKLVSFVTS